MPSAELAKLVALNRYLMLRGTAPMPVTSTGIVRQTSVDANGITQSYSLEVDGAEYPNVPAVGTSFGQGWTVPVYRSGGAAVGDWIVGNYPLSFGSQTPVVVGGITTATPSTFPANFGFWVNGEGGWLVGGGLNDEDGVAIPYGARAEVRSYGIVGYDSQELLTYGLFNAPHTYTEAGVDHIFEAGDQHLGFFGGGHLELRSNNRRLSWMNGTEVLWSSEVIDLGNNNFHTLNWMRGEFWVGENYVGAGFRMGRGADGANKFELVNEANVPLVTMRAGLPGDVNEVYARFGPPDPFPNMTITTQDDDTILLNLHGGALRAGTVTADKMNVNQLSAVSADLGIVTAGDIRMGEGVVGTSFTGLRMYKNGTTYRFEGVNNSVPQAYFGSDGKFYWSAGANRLDATGMFLSTVETGLSNRIVWEDPDTSDTWDQAIRIAGNTQGSAPNRKAALLITAASEDAVGYTFLRLSSLEDRITVGRELGVVGPVLAGDYTSGEAVFEAFGDTIAIRTQRTPASAAAAGTEGDICWDSGAVYICVADNTWKKAAISTW